jgi:uroporphyrinogen-III synthase
VIAPLLDIHFRDGPEISLDGVQAALATSANGVRALVRHTKRRDVPIYAVGPQTSAAAYDAGFTRVKNAQGDGDALAEAAAGWADPKRGVLLHAAGATTKGDLAASLSARGFTVRTETLYDAVAVQILPPSAEQALRAGALDEVLLFSPRTARIFAELVTAAGLQQACAPLTAACISAAAAAPLAQLPFRDVRIAERPEQDSLLALL